MKKKKVNLPKLSLNKEVISDLSQDKIVGGAVTIREQTCLRSCAASCLCSVLIECITQAVSCPVTAC
ncbi:class I lanthipeptide [Chitinophaga varians]|uniref:class I lanthipeptide n=1 Tax=Chitinophaga varians TaxID=2202339 RepID=UPI00165EDAEB|nr:class I lanthipeptide [Chitinophaga varians]MBC9910302.1 class I lanthipeptide [Chitinophaga varians]